MTQPEEQLAQLKRLYEQGLLSEANYRAALIGLGVSPAEASAQAFGEQENEFGTGEGLVDQSAELIEGPDALRKAYLGRLVGQIYRLPLSGVDPKAASHNGSSELQLSALYTALLTHHLEIAEQPGMRPEEIESNARRLSALEVLNREPRLVLLGEPGSGKTTFVNFVALCLAGEVLGAEDANLSQLMSPIAGEEQCYQPWDHGPLLPVRIVLRDLAARGLPKPGQAVGGDTLWDFIVAELGEPFVEYASHLKQDLLERGGLILLDGLDEVPDAHGRRAQVKQIVASFASDFPRCRFLVTSRTYAYQRQYWNLDGFTEAVLSPFNSAQIVHFVEKWYAHVGPMQGLVAEDAQGRAALLATAIERNERLAELATRPLLLTLMASLHAWRGGSLPERREELYADAVDLLLDQWENPKVVRDADGWPLVRQPSLTEWLKADRTVVRAVLNQLAFEAHRDQPQLVGTADVSQERLVNDLIKVARNPDVNPERLIEYVRDRAGLLAARGEGVYAFPHRTFQEYLAACHLTDYGFPDQLADLLRADPQRWREVLLLAGAKAARGTSSAAWLLADALCQVEPAEPDVVCPGEQCWGALLAAQVLAQSEVERLSQITGSQTVVLERVRLWLLTMVQKSWLSSVDRILAGQSLGMLGDERDFYKLVVVPEGPFLMGSQDTDEMAKEIEKPQHKIVLPEFKIGKYLVTNGQFAEFVEAGGYQERRFWTNAGWWWKTEKGWTAADDYGMPFDLPNHPLVGVSWYEALAFCLWLTEVWRAQGKISGEEVVRLPTEAEWEKASRGSDGYLWPWGNEWDDMRCNNGELGLGDTCAVGLFPTGASPYGCMDMAGQVWEWTISLESEYPYDSTDGREDLDASGDMLRVLRGGSFYIIRYLARCAHRLRNFPGNRNDLLGFRIVVSSISSLLQSRNAAAQRNVF